MSKDFTHLHLHTQYSFLDGAIRIKDLIKRVSELGMKQVAVTDHGNMFGALDFYKQARSGGIKPIMGMEAYVTGTADYTEKVRENFHLVLLAENDIGYYNLRKLSSESFINGKYYFPRVDKKLLYKHREGLIASTACLGGEVSKKCAQNDLDGARKAAREFKEIFGPDNFFLEVQPNGIPIQERVNGQLAQMAKEENIRLLATNDCHYVTRDQHDAQNILMAIRQQKAWDDPTLHKHETDAFYIRSGEEMYNLLHNTYPEGFANACEIGRRCNVNIPLGQIYLPAFPCPDSYKDEEDYLRHLCHHGLLRRIKEQPYKVDYEEYQARLNTELEVIIRMGFSGYFLIVQDFINWAKNNEIKVGPGRGSGAGSLVAYVLRITDIDPIPYNLLFERFLNPERVSMPDFDVDFMQERRGEVIQYVADRYGRDRVGQIATYSALNPKSAVKDVARTLGIPFAEINELTKPMPLLIEGKKPDLKQALEYAPKLKERAKTDPLYKRVLQNAGVLEGLFRQAGMHAGGVVIGDKALVEYVPVFSGVNGELITQFDKDKVEDAGLVKFDFLGLKTLDVIAHAEKMVNRRIERENQLPLEERQKKFAAHPHSAHLEQLISPLIIEQLSPNNSPISKEVYDLIASGDTLGIFQIESGGFTDMCRRLKPDCFEDIIAAGALYRPGPMQSGMVDDFIDRKHGRKKVVYPHPLLEPVLKPTYGTIVYQEQVLQAAQVLAGFTLGGADILRRAMGKKKFEEMEKQRAIFVAGAENNGVSREKATQVFDTIEKFAGYGFNKSHSAAYAMITYQTAYLKRFYPVEFMAALLTTSSGSTVDVVKYIHEARSQKIKVLPPDINISTTDFTVDYENTGSHIGSIRFGLGAVKGLGDTALDIILSTREKEGPAKSLYNFLQVVGSSKINKKVLEALIKSGAMDSFGRPRRQLMQTIDKAIAQASRLQKDHNRGQTNMFDMFATTLEEIIEEYPDIPEYSQRDKLYMEKEAVGFYLSGHPLDPFEKEAKSLGAIPTIQLANARHLEEVSVFGVVAELKERPLKSGKGRWAVVVLEDSFGQAEVLCFSKAYEEAESLLKTREPLMVTGRVLIDDIDEDGIQQKPKMRLTQVRLLADAQIARSSFVSIDLSKVKVDESLLRNMNMIFVQNPGEKPVRMILVADNMTVNINLPMSSKVRPSDEFIAALEQLAAFIKVARC